jgi:PAS domain-containing protein
VDVTDEVPARKMLQAALDAVEEAVLVRSGDSEAVYLNGVAGRLFDVDPEAATGESLTTLSSALERHRETPRHARRQRTNATFSVSLPDADEEGNIDAET